MKRVIIENINSKKEIHKKIKKHAPESVHKVKKIIGFKYPKLFFLILSIAVAYHIFSQPYVLDFMANLRYLSYFGVFIAGIFLAFGFSAPFSVAFFIAAQPENIFLATLLGGIGATIGDIAIFKTIKFSFMDEFKRLKKSNIVKSIREIVRIKKHILLKHYLLYVFAGIMIATPLPDEIGVSMLAGLTTVKPKILGILSFLLHSLAILALLFFSIRI